VISGGVVAHSSVFAMSGCGFAISDSMVVMSYIECPACHIPAARSIGIAHCPQCGWNQEAVEKQTRLLLRTLPILVAVFDALLIIWVLMGQASMKGLAFFAALAIVPAIVVVFMVWKTKPQTAAPR
jgi:hypothetical protein